jgi:hypothetical protein
MQYIYITSSGGGKCRSLSGGGVIARGPRLSGGGVFSLSIVFHISTRFFALPMILNKRLSFVSFSVGVYKDKMIVILYDYIPC